MVPKKGITVNEFIYGRENSILFKNEFCTFGRLKKPIDPKDTTY
jgi:hypothetical protein